MAQKSQQSPKQQKTPNQHKKHYEDLKLLIETHPSTTKTLDTILCKPYMFKKTYSKIFSMLYHMCDLDIS